MCALEVERPMGASVTAHFRLPKDVYDSLVLEAKTRGVSLNTLVNQIVTIHSSDDWLMEEMGMLKIMKESYRLLLEMVPDERLSEYGKAVVQSGPTASMMARKGSISPDAILDELRLRSRGGWYSLHETKGEGGKKVFTLMHDLGPRFSVILGTGYLTEFGLVGIHPKITSTSTSVTIEY